MIQFMPELVCMKTILIGEILREFTFNDMQIRRKIKKNEENAKEMKIG